ncbi:MAG: DNA gyrase subunit A [Chloroflexi bacterium]|nr:DNA gyrase subunit A [Chloroflexota bacterium]
MTTDSTFGNIRNRGIEDEMRSSYLDYAMSVIVARALPDVRDGLKPVQRRILFSMHEMGLRPNAAYRKSAAIVGEVMGKYHPHGDAPVYEAMARLAQDFSLRYLLVDGQGNFGSVDGDPPAAMRYTEARMSRITEEILADIDSNTVDTYPNYDDSRTQPIVLPARIPNLLVNGASGIAVGMATNIPPHNLNEIADAISALLENPETTTEELAAIVKGPDFPTGGIIFRMRKDSALDDDGKRHDFMRDAIKEAYADGRGRIMMQARATIEEMAKGNRWQIIVTELPYQVNKASLVEKIADLVKERKITGISDLRDESDRHGMRIVIELGREGQAAHVLNQLYKHTAMQTSFAVNMVSLDGGQPKTMGLKKMLEAYINHRRDVLRRRTEFELEKARDREHILQGYLIALKDLDKIIATIRGADSAEDAKAKLMAKPWEMSDRQAQAVLDLQLRRLAKLEREKIEEEHRELMKRINYLEDLLKSPRKIDLLIRDDMAEIKKDYGDERRTQIVDTGVDEINEEDLIAHQETVVTLSNRGYVKRIPLESYRLQRRGGKGITGMVTREEDAVRHLIVCDTHDNVLFFTERGRVFMSKAWDLPDAKRQAKGIPLVNVIDCDPGEEITAIVTIRDYTKDFMVMATAQGEVKKTPLTEFKEVRRNGKIAMDLEKGDQFVAAKLVHDNDEIVMITSNGQAIRFPVTVLRSASRTSGGVRGIKLDKGGRVVSLEVVTPGHELFSITEKGFGKRTPFDEYRITNRGGQGVRNYQIAPKTGKVIASRTVHSGMELIVISKDGIVIRTRMDQIRMTGRSAQGVSVINVATGDSVASLATIEMGATGPGGGPKGGGDDGDEPEGEQGRLDGIEAPGGKLANGGSKKPTPIRGRQARAAAPAPARNAAAKPSPATKQAATKPVASKPASRAAAKPPARKPAPRRPASRGLRSARLKKR